MDRKVLFSLFSSVALGRPFSFRADLDGAFPGLKAWSLYTSRFERTAKRFLEFGHFGEVTSREDFKFLRWELFFAGLESPLRVMSPENGAIIHSGSQGRSKGSGVDPRTH